MKKQSSQFWNGPFGTLALLGAVTFNISILINGGLPSLSFLDSLNRDPAAQSLQFRNWGLMNTQKPSHIHAPQAWSLAEGDRKIVVAVIDTGVDANHPDLKNNIWSKSEVRQTASAKLPKNHSKPVLTPKSDPKKVKPSSSVSSIYGWDFVKNRPNPKDDHGHGTHVAGIIGAQLNQEKGVSGVAHKVSIMAVKYYHAGNSGAKNLSNTIKAIEYAVANGARIINYSGGGPEFSQGEYLAIKKAQAEGVLFVAAAGNERSNADQVENYYYPSAYPLKNILTVAATNIENKLLPTSNWGTSKVHVAAPGENIYSTLPGGQYGPMTGTSQATAFVSGIAALLLSKNPKLTPVELKHLIMNSVDTISGLKGKVATSGRVNAYRALLALNEKMRKEKIYALSQEPLFDFQKAQFGTFGFVFE